MTPKSPAGGGIILIIINNTSLRVIKGSASSGGFLCFLPELQELQLLDFYLPLVTLPESENIGCEIRQSIVGFFRIDDGSCIVVPLISV